MNFTNTADSHLQQISINSKTKFSQLW